MATYENIITRFNSILENYNQNLRIDDYNRSLIKLSNGVIITGKNKNVFRLRLSNTRTSIWIENFDKLFCGEITEYDIKHQLAINRGKKSWNMNSETIRKNLNTGIPWSKGKPGTFTGKKHSTETKHKIGQQNSGKNNGMYGRLHSDEEKCHLSKTITNLILTGKFTPKSSNRFGRWNSTFDGKKYRSSWEALYHYHNQQSEYEQLRLMYMLDGKNYVYIVDFIDHVDKLVVEVKPYNLFNGTKWEAKYTVLKDWAKQHDYKILLIDQQWLTSNVPLPDLARFDSETARKIGYLYETAKSPRNQ
jgi:hypothetical protein